jgi:hypothetical protein
MLSQRDALDPPFGLGGFEHRTVSTYAHCPIWEDIADTPAERIPIVIDLIKMGNITIMHISGCNSYMEWGSGKQPGAVGLIEIDYTIPYTFAGQNSLGTSFVIPMDRNYDGSKNGGQAYLNITKDRKIVIKPAEDRESRFKRNTDSVNYPQFLGAENITVMWNTEVLPYKTAGTKHLGATLSSLVLTGVTEDFTPDFTIPTRTFTFTNDKGVEEEMTLEVNSDNKPVSYYSCSEQLITPRDDEYVFTYDEDTDKIELLHEVTDIDLINGKVYNIPINEKTYIMFNNTLRRLYEAKLAEYISKAENIQLFALHAEGTSLKKGEWIFKVYKKLYMLESLKVSDDKQTVTVTINDGTNTKTYEYTVSSKQFTEVN